MEKPLIKRNGKKTSILFYTLNDIVEKNVRAELEEFFGTSELKDLQDIIYTCVKELMVNASKSNIKKTFFIEAKINPQDRELYEIAKRKVKKLMTDEYLPYVRNKLQKYNHHVNVNIEDRGNGIVITVINPTPLLDEEENKIREMLQIAMSSDFADLALYYSDDSENYEGASLGLILIVDLLRQVGIDPSLFRIGMIEENTVARIEIPLSPNYNPIRNNN